MNLMSFTRGRSWRSVGQAQKAQPGAVHGKISGGRHLDRLREGSVGIIQGKVEAVGHSGIPRASPTAEVSGAYTAPIPHISLLHCSSLTGPAEIPFRLGCGAGGRDRNSSEAQAGVRDAFPRQVTKHEPDHGFHRTTGRHLGLRDEGAWGGGCRQRHLAPPRYHDGEGARQPGLG